MASEFSTASTRSDNIEHHRATYGIDLASAQLLYRAEKLQEKGQLDQALAYFDVVLQQHPHVQEARLNADMIRRMQSEVTSTSLTKERALPREAELFWYGERSGFPMTSCDYYRSLKRLPNGRSEFKAGGGFEDEMGVCPEKIVFSENQSHQMWTELLKAIDNGSGLSDRDPTPWGMDGTDRAMGEQMTVKIQGEKDQIYYTNGNSPVDRIVKKFLEARR